MRKLIVLGLAVTFAGCGKKNGGEADAAAETAAPVAEQAPSEPAKKSAPAPAAQQPAGALPGAADVRAALDRKDYSGAVDRLIALRGLAIGDDKWMEYKQLGAEVGERLSEAVKTDPAAAPALAAYRAYMYGR